jgi:guanylate kinase
MTDMIVNTDGMNAEKEFDRVVGSTHTINRIFVFTGPVGAGLHSIADMIKSTHGFQKVIAYTTRPRRYGEVEGQDAYYVRPAEFFQAQQKSEFLEVSEVNGDLYGIKYQDIEQMRMEGNICLVLGSDGAENLKEIYGEYVVRIFIYTEECDSIEMVYKEECEFSLERGDLAHSVYDLAKSLERLLHRNLLELD